MPGTHAYLSASSAARWLVCPPSAALNAAEPDSTSKFAEEGTDAHTLAEIQLSENFGKLEPEGFARKLKAFQDACKYYDNAFSEAVDVYCGDVMETYNNYANDLGYEPIIDLEQRVEFDDIVPGGYGTADVVIIAGTTLHVIDLKFGRGVPVSAVENPQLMLYGYGALRKYETVGDFELVSVTINQPRLNSKSTYTLAADALIKWAENYVKPRAELTAAGGGELTPEDHACRFCKVRAKCKALADQQLEIATEEFAEKPEGAIMTPEPGIVSTTRDDRGNFKPITDSTDLYSGCYARVSLSFYPYNVNGNKGIAAGINNVQKLADGDYLGGRSRAEDDFDDWEDELDDDII